MSVDSLLRRTGDFRNLTHLEPTIFLMRWASYFVPNISLPRNYLIRDDYAALGFVQKLRSCQISDINRAFRTVLWTRNVPVALLAIIFDQSESATHEDVKHSVFVVVELPQYCTIVPNNEEYYNLKGGVVLFSRIVSWLWMS